MTETKKLHNFSRLCGKVIDFNCPLLKPIWEKAVSIMTAGVVSDRRELEEERLNAYYSYLNRDYTHYIPAS